MRQVAKLSATVFAVFLSFGAFAGCGDDDDLPTSGIGGSPSTGGSTGQPGNQPGGIGDRCESNGDCNSGFCLRADDTRDNLMVGTPPSGLCTVPCEGDTDCLGYEQGTLCLQFTPLNAYCVQTCMPGEPASDENKCYRRPEFSCQAVLAESGIACDTTLDCPEPFYCSAGECSLIPFCLPRCGSDADCPEGRSCDLGLGECVTEPREGKALGETCNPMSSDAECRGLCVPVDESGRGECFELCSIGAPGGCGYEDATDAPVRCALTIDLGLPVGSFDDAVCAKVCNCTADCPGEQKCYADGEPAVCATAVKDLTSVDDCPEGVGGAGGASN